jgi:hypothetical protein
MLNYLKQLEASEKLTPMHDNSTIKINVKDKKKVNILLISRQYKLWLNFNTSQENRNVFFIFVCARAFCLLCIKHLQRNGLYCRLII